MPFVLFHASSHKALLQLQDLKRPGFYNQTFGATTGKFKLFEHSNDAVYSFTCCSPLPLSFSLPLPATLPPLPLGQSTESEGFFVSRNLCVFVQRAALYVGQWAS